MAILCAVKMRNKRYPGWRERKAFGKVVSLLLAVNLGKSRASLRLAVGEQPVRGARARL